MCGSKLFLKVTKTAEIIRFPPFSGANDVTRTHDLLITNQLLYRLSYISIFTFGGADLILTNQLLYQLSYTSAGRHGAGRPGLTQMIVYHSLPAPSRRKLPSAAERRGWASSAVPGARGGRRGLPRPPREGPRGAAGDMQRRADITSCISASFPSLFRRSFCRNPFQSAFPRLGAVSQNSTKFDIFPSFPGKMFGRRILHNFFDNSFYQKLFTLSTEFSTARTSCISAVFRLPSGVFHRRFSPLFPFFHPSFSLHNTTYSPTFSVFSFILHWTAPFLHRAKGPVSKKQAPALYISFFPAGTRLFPLYFSPVTSLAQRKKRPEGRFSTGIFRFPQPSPGRGPGGWARVFQGVKVRGRGTPGSGWHRR